MFLFSLLVSREPLMLTLPWGRGAGRSVRLEQRRPPQCQHPPAQPGSRVAREKHRLRDGLSSTGLHMWDQGKGQGWVRKSQEDLSLWAAWKQRHGHRTQGQLTFCPWRGGTLQTTYGTERGSNWRKTFWYPKPGFTLTGVRPRHDQAEDWLGLLLRASQH